MSSALTKSLLTAGLLGTLGIGASVAWKSRPVAPPLQPAAQPVASASAAPATSLSDALRPQVALQLDTTRPLPADWVTARPGFQSSRSAAERGGVEPCATQPVDASGFEAWAPLAGGRWTMPQGLELAAGGHFDLVVHLHGEEPVLRELLESKQRFVLFTLTLPMNQSYAPSLSGKGLETLVSAVEAAVSTRLGREAHVGHLALSAWSAGFVGVEAALARPQPAPLDAVILVDGLHAPRSDPNAFKAQLDPFVKYAASAAQGRGFLLVSHSSIDPPDFASTTECAHYLISTLDGKPVAVRHEEPMGLELVEYFSRGAFHVRGYAGNDKADHCAQLAVLRSAFEVLGKRWAR